MSKKIILYSVTALFIALFLYTGFSKLVDTKHFVSEAEEFNLFQPAARWLAWSVAILELLVVILLIVPRWRLLGLYACFSLMLVFTGYIFWLSRYTEYVNCDCGGILEQLPTNMHLLLNVLLATIAIPAIRFEKSIKQNQHV